MHTESERVREKKTVDWHLVNTSYIMRHLQFSTTCCFASQTAQAVKTLLVSVSVCVRLCVSVYKSDDVGKVNRGKAKTTSPKCCDT